MLAPVLHPLVLARLMSGLAAALLVTAALRVAWRVLRSDSERRGQAPGDAGASEAQIANERQAELVASLVQVALAIAALGLVLTVLAADGLSDSIRGAMCAWGVFSSTRAGFAALGTSAVATVACALWLVVHRLDLRLLRPTLTRDKLAATFALAPLLWLDLGLTWTFFAQLDLSAVASCCSSSLDPGVGHVFGASGGPRFLAFGVALALGLAAAASALLTRRRPTATRSYLTAAASAGAAVATVPAVLGYVAPYVYGTPRHLCPFCLLHADAGGIGWPLLGAWLAGSALGLSLALVARCRRRVDEPAVADDLSRALGRATAVAWLALVALCVFPVARYYVASGGASLFTG
ncbi:MAG: hypothetical protein KC543_01485 [Myxococcales bacterium]|nr:hypothetical protein [Myxococcales bacterium]